MATDGAVTLYHDNTAILATASDGVDITGNIDFSGGILSTNGSVQFVMDQDDNGGEVFVFGHNAADATTNELMRLTADGVLGIGTSNPTLDSSLAGVSVASGSAMVQVHNAAGAIVKVSDPSNGSNRGAQFAQIGTTAIVNNCESGSMLFGTGNTLRMTIDANGHITMPTQSAFLVHASSNVTDVGTGDTTVAFGTERFDQNGDFSSNTFTAPVNGRYQLSYSIYLESSIEAGVNYVQSQVVTSNKSYFQNEAITADMSYLTKHFSLLVDMDANDTATVSFTVSGGSGIVDYTSNSYFSGFLAC